MTPTAGQLLDAFLAHRERAVGARTLARDRHVIERFRESLDADGPYIADELTGRPLAREHGGAGLSDLLEVDAVVNGMERFLRRLPDGERERAALGLRQFVSWLGAGRQLHAETVRLLLAVTREYAPPAPSARRPRYRPPGALRRW
ncbi:MAG: hypothetical protein L0I76_10935 [Pseudonocardia sp.]|nr:hypothetical protein [Pseudonocardia sp.]